MREQVLKQKQELVSEIKEKFENSNSAVVVQYLGLTVEQVTDLRRQLHDENVEFKVYKNTMSRRAAEDAGYTDLLGALTGPNAIAFSEDAVAPSRILSKFAKKNKALVIKSGVVEGKVVDVDTLKELSELPNKEGMLAMLLGALQSPLRDFAWAMKQISEQKESGEPTEETKEEPVVEAPAKDEEKVVETPAEEKPAEEKVEEQAETVDQTKEEVEEAVEEKVEETKEAVEEAVEKE